MFLLTVIPGPKLSSLCAALSEQRYLQPPLTHLATSAAWAVGIRPDSCCLVLWSVKCNHHYPIALLSPLGAVPSIPASWLGNHCLKNSSCLFKIQLECSTWWPFVIGISSGWLCEQVFPFICSKFTGNYWLTPLLLCYGMVGKERDWSIFSTLPCRVNDILFCCITGERKRSFFITSLINS